VNGSVDIQALTIVELKAAAYDQIALGEQCQFNVKAIGEELNRRAKQPKQPVEVKPEADKVV
jgi:hypothetical protein